LKKDQMVTGSRGTAWPPVKTRGEGGCEKKKKPIKKNSDPGGPILYVGGVLVKKKKKSGKIRTLSPRAGEKIPGPANM